MDTETETETFSKVIGQAGHRSTVFIVNLGLVFIVWEGTRSIPEYFLVFGYISEKITFWYPPSLHFYFRSLFILCEDTGQYSKMAKFLNTCYKKSPF